MASIEAVEDAQNATIGHLQWGPIFAGTVTAASLAFVLHSFAAAVGLALSSSAPTWRETSLALVFLSGFYVLLVALASYGLGGYVAGRLRTPLASASTDEAEFRDGTYGLCVWGLATLLSAILALGLAASIPRLAAPSGGQAGPASSVGGENLVAMDIDRLFRSNQQRTEDYEFARAEAGRILLTASSHDGVHADDRTALARIVEDQTGVPETEAATRVATGIDSARDNIRRARTVGVIIAFSAGAAALVGAAVAWFAASLGGRHRNATISPHFTWRRLSEARRKASSTT